MINKIHWIIVTLAVFVFGGIARSTTITWTNTAGGNWSTAANWSPNQVPNATNDVAINVSGTYVVTLDTSPTINSLTLGAPTGQQTLNTGNNSLTLNNLSLVDTNGLLGLGGLLSNSGMLTVNGQILWTNGGFNPGAGVTITTYGVMKLAGVSGTDYTSTELITNAGDIMIQSGNLALASCGNQDGVLFNVPGGLVDIQADSSIDSGCGGGIFNYGTVQKSGGTNISGIHVNFNNTGTLSVLTGTVVLTAGGTLNGSATMSAGTELNITTGNYGGTAFNVSVASGGQLDLNGPTMTGTINSSGPGTVTFNTGTVNLDPAAPLPSLVVTNGTLTLNGTVTNLLLGGGDLIGSITVDGTMTWTNGTIGPSGSTLTIATNASLVFATAIGTDLTASQPITNAGDILIQSGNLALASCGNEDGVLFNVPGGLVDIQTDSSIDSGCGGAIVNQGTVQKSGGTNISGIHVNFNNTGTLSVLTGTVVLTAGGTLNGSATMSAGTELNITTGNYGGTAFNVSVASGGQLDLNGPTLSGALDPSGPGAVIFNSGTLTLNPAAPLPSLVVTNGTLTLNGTVTNLVLGGGDLIGAITVYGTMTWTNGTIGPSGNTLTIATNASLIFAGTNGTDLTLSQPITNAGDILIQSGNLALASCGNEDGILFNVRGGLLDIQSDSSIDTGCGGAIVNQGTVRKSAGTNTSAIKVTFDNTGTLDAQSGSIGLGATYNLTGGTINIGITGPSKYASVNLSNSAALTGTLSLQFEDGFSPVTGDSFPVLTYGSHSGSFTNLDLPPHFTWQTNYGSTVLTLSVVGMPTVLSSPTLLPGGDIQFSFDTQSGTNYTVEFSTNLTVWTPVFGFIGDGNPITLYAPTDGDSTRGFYRVQLTP